MEYKYSICSLVSPSVTLTQFVMPNLSEFYYLRVQMLHVYIVSPFVHSSTDRHLYCFYHLPMIHNLGKELLGSVVILFLLSEVLPNNFAE